MLHSIQKDIVSLIQKSTKVLILPSSPPDGDSLGSAVALYIILRKLGKEVTVVCNDPVPEVYQFLPNENVIQDNLNLKRNFIITVDCSNTELDHIEHQVQKDKVNIVLTPKKGNFSEQNVTFQHGESKYDLVIVVDAADVQQLGKLYEDHTEFFFSVPVINIDHHASNGEFGKINLVDVTASSTTEVIFDLLKNMDQGESLIDSDVATALLAGIITDTGSFQNANTTPKSLEYASDLVDLGARQQDIIKNVYKTKKLSTLKLWGKILENMNIDEKHKFLWSTIREKDLKETESRSEETGSIIDELLTNVPGIEIALLLKEKEGNLVSGSLRTTTDRVDGSKIAGLFGGGGHVRAAGFRIRGKDIDTVEREVVEALRKFQAERLNLGKEEEAAIPVAAAPTAAPTQEPLALPMPESTPQPTPESTPEPAPTLIPEHDLIPDSELAPEPEFIPTSTSEPHIDIRTSQIFGGKFAPSESFADKLPPDFSAITSKKRGKRTKDREEETVEDILKKASGGDRKDEGEDETKYTFG